METDASDYAFTTILSIVNEKNKVHLITFYFCTFIVVELNYSTLLWQPLVTMTNGITSSKLLTKT